MLMLAAELFVFLVIAGVIWWAFTMLFPLLPLPEPLHRIIYVVVTVIFVVVTILILCQFLLGMAGVVHWQPMLFRGR